MVVKIYISGISGNKEVKKKQQRVQMILDSKCVNYEAIDITEPGREKEKETMQQRAKVREVLGKHPLPPQIFNEDDYCGDYEDFDLANETDELEVFLHLPVPSKLTSDNGNDKVNGSREENQAARNGAKTTEVNGDVELTSIVPETGPLTDDPKEEAEADEVVDEEPETIENEDSVTSPQAEVPETDETRPVEDVAEEEPEVSLIDDALPEINPEPEITEGKDASGGGSVENEIGVVPEFVQNDGELITGQKWVGDEVKETVVGESVVNLESLENCQNLELTPGEVLTENIVNSKGSNTLIQVGELVTSIQEEIKEVQQSQETLENTNLVDLAKDTVADYLEIKPVSVTLKEEVELEETKIETTFKNSSQELKPTEDQKINISQRDDPISLISEKIDKPSCEEKLESVPKTPQREVSSEGNKITAQIPLVSGIEEKKEQPASQQKLENLESAPELKIKESTSLRTVLEHQVQIPSLSSTAEKVEKPNQEEIAPKILHKEFSSEEDTINISEQQSQIPLVSDIASQRLIKEKAPEPKQRESSIEKTAVQPSQIPLVPGTAEKPDKPETVYKAPQEESSSESINILEEKKIPLVTEISKKDQPQEIPRLSSAAPLVIEKISKDNEDLQTERQESTISIESTENLSSSLLSNSQQQKISYSSLDSAIPETTPQSEPSHVPIKPTPEILPETIQQPNKVKPEIKSHSDPAKPKDPINIPSDPKYPLSISSESENKISQNVLILDENQNIAKSIEEATMETQIQISSEQQEETDVLKPLARRDTLKHIKRPSLPLTKPSESKQSPEVHPEGLPFADLLVEPHLQSEVDNISYSPQLVSKIISDKNIPKEERGLALKSWNYKPTELDFVKQELGIRTRYADKQPVQDSFEAEEREEPEEEAAAEEKEDDE